MSALCDLRVCSLRGLRVLCCEVQGARFESPLLRGSTDLLRGATDLLRAASPATSGRCECECWKVARFESATKCLRGGEVFKCCKVPGRWRGFKVLRSAAIGELASSGCSDLISGKESQRILQLYSFWGFEV